MKHSFSMKYNIKDPFPLTEQMLCFFASYLTEEKLAPQTVKGYLSALRYTQISLGLPDPISATPQTNTGRDQQDQTAAWNGSAKDQTPNHYTSGRHCWHQQTPTGQPCGHSMHNFFGFFRLGELLPETAQAFNQTTNLAWGDTVVDSLTNP